MIPWEMPGMVCEKSGNVTSGHPVSLKAVKPEG